MFRPAFVLLIAAGLSTAVSAQISMRPTPAPLVTAERESWYLNGDPISYAGELYYPAGAEVYFNGNEMVRSGSVAGIPLFIRTTLEPGSMVFVPIGGGRLQPYERLRSGDLAGTVGSRAPSFPVSLTSDRSRPTAQAAGAPMLGTVTIPEEAFEAPRGAVQPGPVATSGRAASVPQAMHVSIGDKPSGLNAIYLEFGGKRWFSTGTTVDVDPQTMTRTGDYFGFPVWKRVGDDRIYVATSKTASTAVPYGPTPTPMGKGESARIEK